MTGEVHLKYSLNDTDSRYHDLKARQAVASTQIAHLSRPLFDALPEATPQ